MMTELLLNPRVIAVVATDERGAIGRGMDIPWKCPEDLKRFRKITSGHAVIMGYKTACSIGRALPNRCNIVLSRRAKTAPYPGQHLVRSPEEAIVVAKNYILEEDERLADPMVFVLGGGQIYDLFIPLYQGLHLTTIHRTVDDADVFFPVEKFMQAHGVSNRLYYVKGDRRPTKDGDELTTYAYYGMHPIAVTRMDPVTQLNLPWSKEMSPDAVEEE